MTVNPQYYELAKASAEAAAKQGVTVDPKWIYTQWHIETSGFTSQTQALHHNLGGIMNSSGNWMHFENYAAFADYFGRYLALFKEDGMDTANSFYTYLAALHHGGYFTADLNTYYQACLTVWNALPF